MEEIKKITIGVGDIAAEENEVFSYEMHTHNHYEMTLYEAFDGKICINGRDIDAREGIATLIAPLDFHEITVMKSRNAKYIKISFAADVPRGIVEDRSAMIKDACRFEFVRMLFKEIAANVTNTEYSEKLIACAIHTFFLRGEQILSQKCGNAQRISKAAVGYINGHLSEDITLDSMAKRLSVTPQYLSRAFKESLCVNFSKYLIGIRLRYAEKLMRQSEKTATEICYLAGFGNFSHFSRSFKEAYGISPRDYRKSKGRTQKEE